MDDNPRAFLEELKRTVFRRSVGKIALAVVFAMAVIRFITNLTWYLLLPILDAFFRQSGSVLFQERKPFPALQLVGSVMEFAGTVIAIFYLSRWIQKKPMSAGQEAEQLDLSFKHTEEPLLEAAEAPAEVPAVQGDLGSLAEEANRRDANSTLVCDKSRSHKYALFVLRFSELRRYLAIRSQNLVSVLVSVRFGIPCAFVRNSASGRRVSR